MKVGVTMTFEEFAADLPPGRTEWFTSPAALEKALKDFGVYQPTRQTKRGEFHAGLAFRSAPRADLFADRYSTALSLNLEAPPKAVSVLLPKSANGHFIANGINLADDHMLIFPGGSNSDISGPGSIGSDGSSGGLLWEPTPAAPLRHVAKGPFRASRRAPRRPR